MDIAEKNLILISEIASELWKFEMFNLTSEVKFDLGGQSSFRSKVVHLAKGLCKKKNRLNILNSLRAMYV